MFITYGLDTNDTPARIEEYAANGADEFFAGFIPREWLEKYGWEVCPNRRSLGGGYNYTQVAELKETAREIHRLGKRLNLAVNAHDNGAERMPAIRHTIEIMEEFEPDGYIVADPSVMVSMQKWGINRPLHLSTGVGCFSSDSVRFFCEHFNVSRVVIPRKLTLDEMRRFIEKLTDLNVEFEVMIIGYRCYFNDEDCHSIHSGSHRNLCGDMLSGAPICSNRFPDDWKEVTAQLAKHPLENFKPDSPLNDFTRRWHKDEPEDPLTKHLYKQEGVGSALVRALYQNCGLCAIKELRDMGVHALKVPLRGARDFKLPSLRLVHDVMTHPNPTPEYCRSLINSPSFCDELQNCYYNVPEAHK